MPLLSSLARRFSADQPFRGMSIAACLHVTAETAVFVRALRAGGARVALAASNPLSTQDDNAAALTVIDGMDVYARAGVDRRTYYEHIALALDAAGPGGATPLSTPRLRGEDPPDTPLPGGTRHNPPGPRAPAPAGLGTTPPASAPAGLGTTPPASAPAGLGGPDLVIDDGGDLIQTLHTERESVLPRVRGGCEGTTTGVLRLRRMATEGALAFPVIAASDTPVKRLVDNTRGTGQS